MSSTFQRGIFLLGLLSLNLGALGQQPSPKIEPLPRAISLSKQFVIYDADRVRRSKISRTAEELKEHWLAIFGRTDEWKYPILIVSDPKPALTGAAMETRVFESDASQLKVQITFKGPLVLPSDDFERQIIYALALELVYRENSLKAGGRVTEPPKWLVEGLREETQASGEGISSGIYQTALESGAPPKLDAFLKENPAMMDATSRAIYRAKAHGLLRAVLEMPEGGKKLALYLNGLPKYGAANASAFLEAFWRPEADPSELSKRWVLAMARISASDRVKPLRIEESDKALTDILDVSTAVDARHPEKGTVSGAMALPGIAKGKGGRYLMDQKTEELLRLEIRAHPMFRPVVEEYRMIAATLSKKPGKNVTKRIGKNDELRSAIVKHGQEMADYLNWVEATKLNTYSGTFEEMLEVKAPPPRTDAISRQMDAWEARGW